MVTRGALKLHGFFSWDWASILRQLFHGNMTQRQRKVRAATITTAATETAKHDGRFQDWLGRTEGVADNLHIFVPREPELKTRWPKDPNINKR